MQDQLPEILHTKTPRPREIYLGEGKFLQQAQEGFEGSALGRHRDTGCISDAKYSHSPQAAKLGRNPPGTVAGKTFPKQEVDSCPKELPMAPRRVRVPRERGTYGRGQLGPRRAGVGVASRSIACGFAHRSIYTSQFIRA